MSCLFARFRSKRIALAPDFAPPSVLSTTDLQRLPKWLEDIKNYRHSIHHDLHPAVKELDNLIQNDHRIKMLISGMCDELAIKRAKYPNNEKLRTFDSPDDLLRLFDYMVRCPPLWSTHMFIIGLEGAPFDLLMQEAKHTTSGYALFLDPEVNVIMENILKAWGTFLQSAESAACLNDASTGWFNSEPLASLVAEANLHGEQRSFEEIYVCDTSKPHYGFTSWDNFFIRQLRPGVRPVASPYDDSVIANACESKPWRVAYNVCYEDKFWAKGGPYSLRDMLAKDDLAMKFIGGTVYQAYLSSLAYHRWHSPVRGTIVAAYKIPGTYFSEPLRGEIGNNGNVDDPDDVNWMQSYYASVATRAAIYIQADNPDIGLVAVLAIGMADVSTCEITVTKGQRIEKGEQIGLFHYGGSTYCAIFEPGVELTGLPDPKTAQKNVGVNSQLARVVGRRTRVIEYNEKSNYGL